MYTCVARDRARSTGEVNPTASQGRTGIHAPWTKNLAVLAIAAAAAVTLPACSSGGGGDNGSPNPIGETDPSGLTFSYPYDGQQDVLPNTQLVARFAGGLDSTADDALELTYTDADGNTGTQPLTVRPNPDQPGILCLAMGDDVQPEDNFPNLCIQGGNPLTPNADYKVVAKNDISSGDTSFSAGQTLFSFSTRPAEGRPASGDFQVTEVTPDADSVFAAFNAIRVVFNEPVDPSTVTGDSFTVTGPDGDPVTDAKVTALGRYIVFDPSEDLEPGQYTIAWTSDIVSEFGKPLQAGEQQRTVLSVGETIPQTLTIEDDATSTELDKLDDNILNGDKINNVNISSKLISVNNQPGVGPEDVDSGIAAPIRNAVETTLAEPGLEGFGNTIPAVIRAGQKFQLKGLTLNLNGDIATSIAPSGPIDVNFINDVSVYLQGNDFRNVVTPTAVRLRFDLGIGTLIRALPTDQQGVVEALANGVFNQSVLNIQASGLAIPRQNGDLEISTLGTFPINVNRTDNATVNFELTLVLPAQSSDQREVEPDAAGPFLTAQSPSACLYVFGTPAYSTVYNQREASPTALPEAACLQTLQSGGGAAPFINSFPVESSPAITFSKPLDPATVNADNVQLFATSGGAPTGNPITASYRAEGFSIVVDPAEPLQDATTYQISLGSGLADLEGNPVDYGRNQTGPGQTISFTTEPQSQQSPTPPLLGTLSPGVPCALEGGDFATAGGNNAGHCVGDEPSEDDDGNVADNDYEVFPHPANVSVDAFFSKFVTTESIVLADSCDMTTEDGENATVAVLETDANGQCTGAVPGELAFGNQGDVLTRSFSFRPVEDFTQGTRYRVVVCGSERPADVNTSCSGATIVDDGDRALNTTPLLGTGSTASSIDTTGGPDIVIPFDATAPTENYYANQFTLPQSDTNGNGQFDSDEVAQPGNRSLVDLSLSGTSLGQFTTYLSLTRPIAIGDTVPDCTDDIDDFDTETLSIETPGCIQVSLLPGGINSLTSINIGIDAVTGLLDGLGDEGTPIGNIPVLGDLLGGLGDTLGAVVGTVEQLLTNLAEGVGAGDVAAPIQTGRVLLRFPEDSADTAAEGEAQYGYIVEKCTGTIAGQSYDYEPCFVASLDLIANAPDAQIVSLPQQRIDPTIVGPVTFEQNGRLVISLKNLNPITLDATALVLPATATIGEGNLNFQLVGSPTHGGREFPTR